MNSIGRIGTIGRTCPFCRGNAIKHAAWNIRNANTFGRWLAKTLGDAHEATEGGLQTTMDLHNNSIGLTLFDTYGAGEALFKLRDVLQYGMPLNSAEGLKFIINGNIVSTKDYPNED